MKIYIVYESHGPMDHTSVKAFKDEKTAKDYCEEKNKTNNPEYDTWGHVRGLHCGYYEMELE